MMIFAQVEENKNADKKNNRRKIEKNKLFMIDPIWI